MANLSLTFTPKGGINFLQCCVDNHRLKLISVIIQSINHTEGIKPLLNT